MGATPDDATVDDRLTAELSRQLALGNDEVSLSALSRETDLEPASVETVMGRYERRDGSPVERVGGDEVAWRLRRPDE